VPQAITVIVEQTRNYPYFLQGRGEHCWSVRRGFPTKRKYTFVWYYHMKTYLHVVQDLLAQDVGTSTIRHYCTLKVNFVSLESLIAKLAATGSA
jgi:hypothetical protein